MDPITFQNMLWLVDEPRFQSLSRLVRRAEVPSMAAVAETRGKRLAAREMSTKAARQVAVLPITGMITKSYDVMCWIFGGTPCDEVSMVLDILADMPEVDTILLQIDSPGGTTYGVEELAAKIYSLRQKKEILAIADPLACSAAYWIGTAASKLYCTPSGDVGSVGVYRLRVDESKALEAEGVSVSVIQAGKYKAEGMPFRPMGDDEKAFLQADVDRIYANFVGSVAKHRGVSVSAVLEKFGQGRALAAPDALAAGMIDGLITFEGAYLSASRPTPSGRSMAAVRHEQAKRAKAKARLRAALSA